MKVVRSALPGKLTMKEVVMQPRWNARAVVGLLLVAGSVVSVDAQTAPTALRLQGGLAYGQTLTVTADQPAHFAVFAVARSAGGNPILLLTGAADSRQKRMQARPLSVTELSRFAPASEVAIIVLAPASSPSLDAFTVEGRAAVDLVIGDSAMSDGQQLVSSLAATVFGKDVRYTARILPMDYVSETPTGPRVVTNACGESMLSASPSTGFQPPSRNGWFLTGGIGVRDFDPRYFGASESSIADDEMVGRFQTSDGAYYAVVGTQLPGCMLRQALSVPSPTPRPTPPVPVTPSPSPSVMPGGPAPAMER